MRFPLAIATLLAASRAGAATSDPPTGIFALGYAHAWVLGPSPTAGNGAELTFLHYPRARGDWAFGGIGQAFYYGGHGRYMVGAEATYLRLFGLELGYALRSANLDREQTHSLHIAPFATIGLVSIALRTSIPIASPNGHGFEFAPTLTVKLWPGLAYGQYCALSADCGRTIGFGHGRPMEGALPPVARGRRRRLSREVAAMREDLRHALAGAWLEAARREHSSIGAFLRLARELRAHGAPRALIERARRAAREEAGHARACFALASRYAGETLRAGPFARAREPVRELSAIARESFVEGVIGEGIGSAMAREALGHAKHVQVRKLLRRLAREEARHAELARDVLAFTGRPADMSLEPLPETTRRDPRGLGVHGHVTQKRARAIAERVRAAALRSVSATSAPTR